MDAADVIAALQLERHPEGGWYRETWRGVCDASGRAVGTAIHYLLRGAERSHWHRVDADEVWLYHAGAPLELAVAAGGGAAPVAHALGADLAAGQRPQAVVPARAWQTARTTGAWTLVSCVVAPGFEFAGFELAPPGWSPPGS